MAKFTCIRGYGSVSGSFVDASSRAVSAADTAMVVSCDWGGLNPPRPRVGEHVELFGMIWYADDVPQQIDVESYRVVPGSSLAAAEGM